MIHDVENGIEKFMAFTVVDKQIKYRQQIHGNPQSHKNVPNWKLITQKVLLGVEICETWPELAQPKMSMAQGERENAGKLI